MNPSTLGKLTRRVGLSNVARLLVRRLRGAPDDGCYAVRADGFPHPFVLRPHGSDPAVFQQVIRQRGYDVLPPDREPAFIVDCGANVGFSSVFFLERYPNCRLVAVEPDPKNFAVLARNLAPYGARAKALNTGVWSHPAKLKISDDIYRDGREWARMVRECLPDEAAQFTATDIGTILRESGEPRIGLLKIDVEKSEKEIFARNFDGWLDRVDAIAIELHDDECERVFHSAMRSSNVPFEFRRVGELTVGLPKHS